MPFTTPLMELPSVGFTVAFADAVTTVEATIAPYSNTAEVVFFNFSADDRVFVRFVDLANPPTLPLGATFTTANSIVIPTGVGLTLSIGPEGYRNPIATVAQWIAGGSGSNIGLAFRAETFTAAFELGLTYVQTKGGGA